MGSDNAVVLHHIGYAVKSIETEAPRFAKLLDATWDGVIYHDPLQQARVTFLSANQALAGTPKFELVEGDGEDTPLSRFVAKGGGLHHICYQVDDLAAHVTEMKANGALLIKAAQPAIAFAGKPVVWMFARPQLLLEYIES
ncbi:VOC family protein [Bryobacter aggregatus]|uniref:VOC family protein n=1 Tax=Bryobacter aggregatus TaxID=360054 RepID=UPI0004E2708C|nr:VOC family protein [Bryobacter aggregatus]